MSNLADHIGHDCVAASPPGVGFVCTGAEKSNPVDPQPIAEINQGGVCLKAGKVVKRHIGQSCSRLALLLPWQPSLAGQREAFIKGLKSACLSLHS